MAHKKLVSFLTGFAISAFSFFCFLAFLLSIHRNILLTVLLIFYLSIIVFLVLWNKTSFKKVKYILLIPAFCLLAGISILGFQYYINRIPIVSENNFLWSKYSPFDNANALARLNAESNLKFENNYPIIDGATALYPVYASFAQAVYPKEISKNIQDLVLCSTTNMAFDNLLEGIVDIIFCAEPSSAQLERFIEAGKALKLIPIGKEAFVFFVNKRNNVDNLTVENVIGIYSGRITNWKELNGHNQRIKAYQRPNNSGSQTMLEKIMGNNQIMDPRTEKVQGMLEIVNRVAVYRNFSTSIGYSFLHFTTEMVKNDQIKLLSINGIYPSFETIQNNDYPFSDCFFAIYIESKGKNENIENFLEWILSEQGQELIQKSGYVPIRYGK